MVTSLPVLLLCKGFLGASKKYGEESGREREEQEGPVLWSPAGPHTDRRHAFLTPCPRYPAPEHLTVPPSRSQRHTDSRCPQACSFIILPQKIVPKCRLDPGLVTPSDVCPVHLQSPFCARFLWVRIMMKTLIVTEHICLVIHHNELLKGEGLGKISLSGDLQLTDFSLRAV